MDNSTPYVEIPLSMQHPSVSANKERVTENDFQQISSQTLLDFLPSLHNVTKGGLDIPEFNLPTNENMQGGLHSSFKVNDSCNLLLNPFSDSQQLGHGMSFGQRNEIQANDTSSHSGNVLNDSNYLNVNTSAAAHHSQGPAISLSSHIFSKNVEGSMEVPSSYTSSMLPFNSSYEDGQFNKNFVQLENTENHIESDNSHLVMRGSTIATKSGQNYSEQSGESMNIICDTGSLKDNLLVGDSNESNICNISDGKLNLKDDLEHINLHHLNSEETKVVENVVTCAFCPRSFKTQEHLSKHEALHPYQTSAIQCSKCGEILGNYMLLQEHKQYEDYLSSCDLCGQLFPNEDCMICHIRNAHNDVDDIFDEDSSAPEDLQGSLNESSEAPTESCEETLFNQNSLLEDQTGRNVKGDVTLPPQDKLTAEDDDKDETNEELTASHFQEENLEANATVLDDINESCSSHLEADDPYSVEQATTVEESACLNNDLTETSSSKPQKTRCRYCTKKCTTGRSLIRHERSHPYATAAMKCNLCLEVVENYKAFKAHKKNLGAQVSCITCNQVCPNDNCLKCHVRNVHNNFVYGAPPVYNLDDSNDDAFEVEGEDEEGDSDSGALSAQQYSVSKYTVGDSGAPLRITIKQEKEEIFIEPVSPSYSAPTPPTPSTPSPQGAPSPSPPAFVYESEPSEDADDDQEYEPYASDQSVEIQRKKGSRRKSALRSSRKSLSGSHFLSSSEESDHDESADFNYSPQTNSESEENSDEDPEWDRTEKSLVSPKKRTRRNNPLSDDDSDVDPDWGRQSSSAGSKKRGRRRKGPLSDDSDNDYDWVTSQNSFVTTKKRSARKKSSLSDDDSDYDPDWKQDDNSTGSMKKKMSGKRGRKKTIQVAFFVPAIPVPKVKRPRARGLGGQKAQDAAAALAQAVEDMETTVPELKTVIKPVRRSVTKASFKTYNEMYDDDYDYLLDVKPEPKEGPEDSEPVQNEQDPNTPAPQSFLDSHNPYDFDDEMPVSNPDAPDNQNVFNVNSKNNDQQEEQIVVKAEPYDFQDDDDDDDESNDPSYGTDLYFSKKFYEPNLKYTNSSNKSPTTIKTDPDVDEKPKKELRYVCKICGRALQYRSHLVRHLRRVHDGEGVEEVMRRLMKCRFCEKPYSNELSLINHEKLHDGTSKMKCNKCEERFDDKNALRRHQRKMHWEHQPVECEICKKQLSDNTCLKAHMKHMHGAEEKKVTVFTCETCGRQLHTKTAFQNHVASKCGTNLLFPCETCGKSFSFKGSLKAHQLLHTGVKSFLCKFCGKAFHQKGEMKRHERKHTGEKPFVCEVCGRAFAYRESLLGHSAVHTGIKPFPCKTCGMRFSCSGNLVKHRRSNNCKGSSEQGDITVVNLDAENTQESTNNGHILAVDKPANLLPETATKPPPEVTELSNENRDLQGENSCAPQMSHSFTNENEKHKIKQESAPATIGDLAQQVNQSAVNSVRTSSSSIINNVVKPPPGISVRPTSALQSTSKETKPFPDMDVSQSYPNSSNAGNRLMGHLNPMYGRHDNNVAIQNNYNSHNLPTSFSENHFRQTNQVSANDRRYSQFSIEGYASRPDQYFDHQSLMRHDLNRQVMERAVERQTPRFLDCFSGVRFSGVDTRNPMQSYHGATIPHTSSYSNIHSGHLGNYAAAHPVNHSANPANMYGSNTMMQGSVGFPAFTANNHMAIGYGHNNTIPAHSVTHASSYPTSHMSHLEALFGHFSQNAASNSLQRLSSQTAGSTATGNPSVPSNHRV